MATPPITGLAGTTGIESTHGSVTVAAFFEKDTSTISYVVHDEKTRDAVIVDPVLDYDPAACVTAEKSVALLIDYARRNALNVQMLLETHAHADHLSAAQALKREFPGARLTIGARIVEVQALFRDIYGHESWFQADGHQFDRLVKDGETVRAGALEFRNINTPGHTPACSTWLLNGVAAFTGDSMFIPDSGTGRCDFPGGSATDMYDSIVKKIYALPDETVLFVGHDYQPGGRELRWHTTVGEAKASNIQLKAGTSREQYVEFRTTRDRTLSAPRLLHPSVQVNINAGQLPRPDEKGRRFIKMPLHIKL
jgi:glyoxylase-like metal-dependent hydrolase (beta-lactamase superfamily II)